MNRKKLIELIRYGRACPNEMDMFDSCYRCKYARVVDCDIERLADYLIAHGVTFAKDANVLTNAYSGDYTMAYKEWNEMEASEG